MRVASWILYAPLVGISGLLSSWSVQANTEADDEAIGTGVLMLQADPKNVATPIPALNLGTDVKIEVHGPIAKVRVTQNFVNQSQSVVTGQYAFPLPDKAAVRYMEMVVGQRKIIGKIREKNQAQNLFNEAKKRGQNASLVSQTRPNLFNSQIANVAPKSTLSVTIEYIEPVQIKGNHYQIRYPLTLTPRYSPKTSSDQLSKLPFIQTKGDDLRNRARIEVGLAGSVHDVGSPSHAIEQSTSNGKTKILVSSHTDKNANTVPMNKDFLLSWEMGESGRVAPSVFTEVVEGTPYALVTLMPPAKQPVSKPLPREILFVVDTSGSMAGQSMEQAKASLKVAINKLQPNHYFNIVEFNSDYSMLYPNKAVLATPENVSTALKFIDQLEADGGTEMVPALKATLSLPPLNGYLRQVVFMTDGAVDNEKEIYQLINNQLGKGRLFTVGIGSAPNTYLMRKFAERGGGRAVFVSDEKEVASKTLELFDRLENPLIKNLQLKLPGDVKVETWPNKIPDLYWGEPIVLAMKMDRIPEKMTVIGDDLTGWTMEIPFPRPIQSNRDEDNAGIAGFWARSKIEHYLDRLQQGDAEDLIAPKVLDLGLRHQLLTPYTSFVAIEAKSNLQNKESVIEEQIPNLVPEGSSYPQTDLGMAFWRWLAALSFLAFWLIPTKSAEAK